MKKLKLNLGLNGKEMLSRVQMKSILGGYGSGSGNCSVATCTLYSNGSLYYGSCGMFGGYNPPCLCITSYGSYTPSSGTSHCVV